jgi:hypothetical protein
MAGAEHFVVVVRQDEDRRSRSRKSVITVWSGGRSRFSMPAHKAIVR